MASIENKRWRLAVEFGLLFLAIPLAMLFSPVALPKLPVLTAAALACGRLLWRHPDFRRSLSHFPVSPRGFFKGLALRAVGAALLLSAGTLLIRPEAFLAFPLERTLLWLAVMTLYPFLSALPQELIYRAFFFHRYRDLFPGERALLWASSLCFAFLHVIFANPVAPLLTVPGGYLFGRTYARTGSLPAAAIEHALYGNILFTTGLGIYFFR